MDKIGGNVAVLYGGPETQREAARPAEFELQDIFAGADVGLALFDRNLCLLACNKLYRTLCGYTRNEARTGTSLIELMRLSLGRQNLGPAEIDRVVDAALSRLEPGSAYAFRYTSPSGRVVDVRRRKLPNGTLVETVREVEMLSPMAGMDEQFAQIADTARARMMHALDVMADGFALYDAQDRLVVYNRKYVEFKPLISDVIMPGVSHEEMLREGARRGSFVLSGMTPDEYVAWRLHQHRNPGDPYLIQICDGRWLQVHEHRTDDGGTVGIRSDVTEMKKREFEMLRISKELHDSNVHFDVALNNMIQGLCMFGKDQRLIVCNRRYLDLYGFSADVVKPGMSLREILDYSVQLGNYTAEQADRALAERRDPSRLSQRVIIKQRLKDGRVIAVMNEPMADGGSIATYQDITETERYAEQLVDHALKLERSNRELQDFAYVASHDLQEPLRKIEAFGDRLLKKYGSLLPEDGQMFIDRMKDASGRMRLLINDLLGYSRVTSKTNPFARVNLNAVLEGVLSDLQVRIEETHAEIKFGELPRIDGDQTQMRQLFQNIIGNALKFRKKDVAPVIEIAGRIDTTRGPMNEIAETLVLTIADNGIGFDNQYKEQIFTIFQRLHGRLEYEGTGVGLATVRKIVERHRGTIDADGRPGEGATFIITLPVSQSGGS